MEEERKPEYPEKTLDDELQSPILLASFFPAYFFLTKQRTKLIFSLRMPFIQTKISVCTTLVIAKSSLKANTLVIYLRKRGRGDDGFGNILITTDKMHIASFPGKTE